MSVCEAALSLKSVSQVGMRLLLSALKGIKMAPRPDPGYLCTATSCTGNEIAFQRSVAHWKSISRIPMLENDRLAGRKISTIEQQTIGVAKAYNAFAQTP